MPLDPTKPVRFADPADKRPVRIIASDLKGASPIVAAITDAETNSEWIQRFRADGTMLGIGAIVNVPETHTVERYVNVHRDENGRIIACSYATRKDADADAGWGSNLKRIACLHFTRTFEEGEGLNA
jgi:hypothetical protein